MNNLFKEKDFMSVDKEQLIKTSIIENIGWFQITNVNFEKYKSFFLLIKLVQLNMFLLKSKEFWEGMKIR